MIKVKKGKITVKGNPDELIADFMVALVWFIKHVMLPTHKDKQVVIHKLERMAYLAFDAIKDMEKEGEN